MNNKHNSVCGLRNNDFFLIFFFVGVKPGLLQRGMNICVWKQGPGAIRVSESRMVDTTDWSKLHGDQRYDVGLSQNVSCVSSQKGSDKREGTEAHVTISADVLEARYMLEGRYWNVAWRNNLREMASSQRVQDKDEWRTAVNTVIKFGLQNILTVFEYLGTCMLDFQKELFSVVVFNKICTSLQCSL